MPVGELAMHYVLCKIYKIKIKKDCLWKQRTHKITKIRHSVRTYTVKICYRILVPDFPSWFRQMQLDLPHWLRTRQTAHKMFISCLVWRQRKMAAIANFVGLVIQPLAMVAYTWHLNIEILSRHFLLLCWLKMYGLILYRLPLTMVIATASRHPQRQRHETLLQLYVDIIAIILTSGHKYVVGFVEKTMIVR